MTDTLFVSALPTGQPDTAYSPFAETLPTIQGFEDRVSVLSSLQRPRKVVIRGSDGQSYNFLCKPKDDLRKDARLMEFNTMINKLLQKAPECRRRQLRIRTYAVVPLNEECGILEWVPNTIGFRNIVNDLYKAKDKYVHSSEIKTIINPKTYKDKMSQVQTC